MDDETAARLAHRRQHGLAVPRRQRPQIDHLDVHGCSQYRLLAALDQGSPCHDRQFRSRAHDTGLTERQHVLVPGIRAARAGAVQHRPMLEENRRIVAAQRRAQQADCVFGIGRHCDPPADTVHPGHLVRLAVPGVTALEEAAGHAHHDRRGAAVVSAPAHRAAVIQLLGGRIRILAELDFSHRQQARERQANRAANNSLFRQAGVEDAQRAVFLLQAQRSAVHPALGPDVFPENDHAGIGGQLRVQRAADGRHHVDPCGFRMRCGARRSIPVSRGREPTLLLQLERAVLGHL